MTHDPPPTRSPVAPYHRDRAPIGIEVFDPDTVAAHGLIPLGDPRAARTAIDPRTGGVFVPCIACGAPVHGHTAPKIRVGVLIRRTNPNLGGRRPGLIPTRTGHNAVHFPMEQPATKADVRRALNAGAKTPPATISNLDDRKTIWFPKVRVGPGCADCADRFDRARAARDDAREPFLNIGKLGVDVSTQPGT